MLEELDVDELDEDEDDEERIEGDGDALKSGLVDCWCCCC